MARFKIVERDLKTVRETERMITRSFNRSLDGMDFEHLRSDLRAMRKAAKADHFMALYFVFAFRIKDIDTDSLLPDMKAYLVEHLRRRYKGRFNEIEEGEGDISNYRKFSAVLNNTSSMFEGFIDTLEQFFDMNVKAVFNVEFEHDIRLQSVSLVFKKTRRTKAPKKGSRKKRKVSALRFNVRTVKARSKKRQRRAVSKSRRRRTSQKRKLRYGKRLRRPQASKVKRTQKLRNLRYRNKRRANR